MQALGHVEQRAATCESASTLHVLVCVCVCMRDVFVRAHVCVRVHTCEVRTEANMRACACRWCFFRWAACLCVRASACMCSTPE